MQFVLSTGLSMEKSIAGKNTHRKEDTRVNNDSQSFKWFSNLHVNALDFQTTPSHPPQSSTSSDLPLPSQSTFFILNPPPNVAQFHS